MVSRLACEYDGMDLEVGISSYSSDEYIRYHWACHAPVCIFIGKYLI